MGVACEAPVWDGTGFSHCGLHRYGVHVYLPCEKSITLPKVINNVSFGNLDNNLIIVLS